MGKMLGYQGFVATLFGCYPYREQNERIAAAVLTSDQQEHLFTLCEEMLEAYTFSFGINGAKTRPYRCRSEAVVRCYFGLRIDVQPPEEICRAHNISRTILRSVLLRAYGCMQRHLDPLEAFLVKADIL